MTQSLLHTELLSAFSLLFSKARGFYQHKADTAGSGNLRRQFAALAKLHQQILYLLPAPHQSCIAAEGMEDLYELSYWYDNKRSHRSLLSIQQQLIRQLRLQKAVIRNADLRQHQNTLLHFTASLQIAADQLVNTKTN